MLAWWWFAASSMVLAALPLAPAIAGAVPACPLRRWTGIPCLTCGGTRAIVALAHGDVFGAVALNPLVAVAAIAFVAFGLAAPIWVAFGGSVPRLTAISPRARVAVAVAIVAAWAWVVFGPA